MGWVRLGMLGMILFIMKFLNENPYKTTLVSTIILSLSEEKKNHLKLYSLFRINFLGNKTVNLTSMSFTIKLTILLCKV